MTIKEQFRDFLDHHPRMSIDKPGPKDMYTQLLDTDGLLNRQIISMHIPYYTSGYTCLDPQYWNYVIKPLYEREYHFEKGKNPMVKGTFWNHLATINKYIEFLTKLDNKQQDATLKYPIILDNDLMLEVSYQQIFYGAPGTGKSYKINKGTAGKAVIRTTFHPDSDYSTFVGAYKPTTVEEDVMTVIGTRAVQVENPDGTPRKETKIVYEFVNQAFLNAYIGAWEKYCHATEGSEPQRQYLVIEEINRGNCAQIFGDLFQLLDRNEYGFSDYPITADADMRRQLGKALSNLTISDKDRLNKMYNGRDVADEVLRGEILLLPNNLFIWATMNTSDQSLFPIDSAFKRRWDWQYVPISDAGLGWQIEVGNERYNWWKFLQKINALIGSTTNSEDKKLGYFFCKATDDGVISAETFVGKVVFYLWNDVFKDYEFADAAFNDADGTKLTFNKYYAVTEGNDTEVNVEIVKRFLTNLGLESLTNDEEAGTEETTAIED